MSRLGAQILIPAILIAILLLGSVVAKALHLNVSLQSLARAAKYKPHFVALLLAGTLTVGILACAFLAFSTDKILQWDETYYANITMMGVHDHGAYAAIQNMLPTRIMGGIGNLR